MAGSGDGHRKEASSLRAARTRLRGLPVPPTSHPTTPAPAAHPTPPAEAAKREPGDLGAADLARALHPGSLLEEMPAAFVAFDEAWRFTFLNPAAERMFAAEATALIGQELWARFPVLRESALERALRGVFSSRQRVESEFRFGPGETWFAVQAWPTRGGVTAQFTDISERHAGEHARRLTEERFRLAADNRALTLYEQDLALRYTWLYPQHPEHARALGRSDLELAACPSGELLTRWKSEVIASGEPQRREVRSELTDGVHYYDVSIAPRRDENGRIIGVAGAALDITERKLAEQALRESEARFQAILDNSTAVIFLKDSAGRYLVVNRQFERLTGRRRSEVLGCEPTALHALPIAQRLARVDREVLASGEPREQEELIETAEGPRTFLSLRFPLKRAEGEIYGLAGIATDITQRKLDEAARRRLAAIVESSDDAIYSRDLAGRITSWNRGAERLYGYTAAEIVGQPLERLLPPEQAGELVGIFERLRRGERVCQHETVRLRKDGTRCDVALTVSAIRDATGSLTGAAMIAHDITERKRAEQQQHALYELAARVNRAGTPEEIFTAALDAIGRATGATRASILLLEADGVMRFRAWRGLSDAYRQTVEGHSPWLPGDPDPQPVCIGDVAQAALAAGLREALAREGIAALAFVPITFERKLRGKFMLYFDAPRLIGAEVIRPAEALASQLAFAIERQRSAEALESLVNERTASLREAIAQMEEFSYSVSHDLRAPLRAFQGYAMALMEDYGDRLDATGRDYLARIGRNSARMDRLIQDLLTYSRLSRRDIELHPVSLDALVRETIQQYPEMQPPAAQIEITGALLPVIAHEPSLTQVVSNLLSNAVKFVAPGMKPHIRIATARVQREVELSVRDNGIGIAPEHQQRLFGLFERIHPPTRFEGTGIGLAIVRRAAERMGGRAGVESDGVNGSRFWVRLPAAEL